MQVNFRTEAIYFFVENTLINIFLHSQGFMKIGTKTSDQKVRLKRRREWKRWTVMGWRFKRKSSSTLAITSV